MRQRQLMVYGATTVCASSFGNPPYIFLSSPPNTDIYTSTNTNTNTNITNTNTNTSCRRDISTLLVGIFWDLFE